MKNLLLISIVSLSFIACSSNKYEEIIKKDLQEKSSFDEDLKYKSLSLEVIEVSTSEYKKELDTEIDRLFSHVFLLEESSVRDLLKSYSEILLTHEKQNQNSYYDGYKELRTELQTIIDNPNYEFKTPQFLEFYNGLYDKMNRVYGELNLTTSLNNIDVLGNIKAITHVKYQKEFADKATEIPNYWTRVTNKFSSYNPVLKAQIKQTASLILNDKGEVYSINYTMDK